MALITDNKIKAHRPQQEQPPAECLQGLGHAVDEALQEPGLGGGVWLGRGEEERL